MHKIICYQQSSEYVQIRMIHHHFIRGLSIEKNVYMAEKYNENTNVVRKQMNIHLIICNKKQHKNILGIL
jgi:hypothetical protein